MSCKRINIKGFTLLEVLIALFIFTILSMMMVGALRSVINTQEGTEANAERLRGVQLALLMMSRDIPQAIDRPVLNASGHEEMSFIGEPDEMTFTHLGLASSSGTLARSAMERTRYTARDHALWRVRWVAPDQAPQSGYQQRKLLSNVEDVTFQYMDDQHHFYTNWPDHGQSKQTLPRAVKVTLTITNWGKLSQLYVIAASSIKKIA